MINVVQIAGESPFTKGTTAGNTVFILAGAYNQTNSVMSSSAPLLGGIAIPDSNHLYGDAVAGYISSLEEGQLATAWMLPNVPGGLTSFSLTITNGSIIDLWALEVSGLGANPTFDKSGTYASTTAGSETVAITTPATVYPNELIIANASSYEGFFGGPSQGYWTSQVSGSTHTAIAYAIQTASGSAYSYTNTNIGANSANCGGIATIAVSLPSNLLFLS
jgi:hypothetical protein